MIIPNRILSLVSLVQDEFVPLDQPVVVLDVMPVVAEPEVSDCIQGTYEDFNSTELEVSVECEVEVPEVSDCIQGTVEDFNPTELSIGGNGSLTLTCSVFSKGGTEVMTLEVACSLLLVTELVTHVSSSACVVVLS